ncbi:MAG: dTDP-4-dehydrorhamnose reductase [Saprospiraceae bacterium]
MKSILVTGASGQLGQEFKALALKFPVYHFLFAGRSDIDLSNPVSMESYFHSHQIDICINCAAYTAVDKAETETEECIAINVDGVGFLAALCENQQIPLVHISTDYIYHSKQNRPYIESDIPNPQGVYAKTKYAGEHQALEKNHRAMVIRTSWVYSSFGNNFVKTMMRLGRERDDLNVVFDQIGTPTYAQDLALAVVSIIDRIECGSISWEEASGVYNYSNEGVASWYDFAKAIFDLTGIQCNLQPIRTEQFPTPAPRPAFSLMDKSLIKETFKLEIPYWRDSLEKMLKMVQ